MDDVLRLRQMLEQQDIVISDLRRELNVQKTLAGIDAQELRRLRRQLESMQAPAQHRRATDKVS